MEHKIIFVGLWIALLSLFGCDKGQFLDSTGAITTENREIGTLTKVSVFDNINVIFTNHLDSGVIKVSAGAKIIRNISTEYRDNTLIIKNKNKYKWTRDLNPDIRVYIPCSGITEIRHESVGVMSCETPLTGNKLRIDLRYGNGKIDLELFYDDIDLHSPAGSITDVILKGKCETFELYYSDYAPCDCRNLQAKKAKIIHDGIQNCFISASKSLEPTITNYGNIYYYGDPEIINYTNTGKGNLIRVEE